MSRTIHLTSRRTHGARSARAGFTLIELLAVLVILSILLVVLLPRLSGLTDNAKRNAVRAFLSTLAAELTSYENRFGDYPSSKFEEKWGSAPNVTNLGSEALYLSLWAPELNGSNLPDDQFSNTDADDTKSILTSIPVTTLFELKDSWGNPIAYFHHRDYGRQDVYLCENEDSGIPEESSVKAHMNPVTKTWFNANTYQLISAGPDAMFGTDDDVANFDIPLEAGPQ